jgi:hypothetical protein
MRDKQEDKPKPVNLPGSSEYGDALSDILKDQERRTELRGAAGPRSGRPRLHPSVPPVLALVSVWLWVFPPAALVPDVPSIPPANQEAGLRIEMSIQVGKILQYVADNERPPGDLGELGNSPVALQYVPLGGNAFQLTGQTGDITVDFHSNDPVSDLLGDAIAIVSGGVSPTPSEEPSI